MFEIYFFDAKGRCSSPIPQPDGRVALEILASYMKVVPTVLVTCDGRCAFESCGGVVVWPDDLSACELETLQSGFPAPRVAMQPCTDLLNDYQDAFTEVILADAVRLPLAVATLRALEVPLLAAAAVEGIDLGQRGYVPSANAAMGREHWRQANS